VLVTSCGSDTTGKDPATPRHRSDPRSFKVADEIANALNLIGVTVHDFYAGKLIFDQYQQFQTIKPVCPQIVTEVRFVRDTPDIDAETLGNERADLADFEAFPSGCSLSKAQATEGHDEPSRFVEHPAFNQATRPHNVTLFENSKSVAITARLHARDSGADAEESGTRLDN
jgi:hypothetical protein